MNPNKKWLIYGAYGYTGKLITQRAIEQGFQPVLAGRSESKTRQFAASSGLEYKSFELNDIGTVTNAIQDFDLIVHAAGPFSATSKIMADACLSAGCHYVDITGEIDVFEQLKARDTEAKSAGILLYPGAGFDVVPTDCLASLTAEVVQQPNLLELAFVSSGGPSRGTLKSSIEGLKKPCLVRKNGAISPIEHGSIIKKIPFTPKALDATAIPWGDVSTAHFSTGINDIKVYLALPKKQIAQIRRFAPILGNGLVQKLAIAYADRFVKGPNEQELSSGHSQVWCQVTSASGETATAEIRVPNGYQFTASSVVQSVRRILSDERLQITSGYVTPSRLFGAAFINEIEGIEWIARPEIRTSSAI